MDYKFKITYSNKSCRFVTEFMDKCDRSIGDLVVEETVTFSIKRATTMTEIKTFLRRAYEASECEVFYIEGGAEG